ncbi:molybdopterin-dependent oxidoreductase [Sulfitobacter aestuarii]|uniref:Molybdopterin-dependent oxidoreductase n=1 Tax=Sulfitobacter aestuarii TaxID=2161676 RepID=A0ABW5U376_9RHOB
MTRQAIEMVKFCLVAALMALPTLGHAADILTVNAHGAAESFSMEELQEMPQTTVVTKNDYVETTTTFVGPKLRDVLAGQDIGPESELIMTALNDFTVRAPASDAYEHDVILALSMDGKPMSIRDKGPIWVIYPMDDEPKLRDDIYNGRLVWQLKSIAVE